METGLFVLSLRSGSLDEEFSIPCNDGKRYVQLNDEVSNFFLEWILQNPQHLSC